MDVRLRSLLLHLCLYLDLRFARPRTGIALAVPVLLLALFDVALVERVNQLPLG
jgi:hypothetical protein